MKRHELEHLIRAAGAITGADEIVVVGSQSILAARPDSPQMLLVSAEADLFTFRDPKDADLIDGSVLLERIEMLSVDDAERRAVRERWQRIVQG